MKSLSIVDVLIFIKEELGKHFLIDKRAYLIAAQSLRHCSFNNRAQFVIRKISRDEIAAGKRCAAKELVILVVITAGSSPICTKDVCRAL